MVLRLSWLLMALVIGAHAVLIAAHGTPDPCRAVGAMAADDVEASLGGVAALTGLNAREVAVTAVEARLREEGLLTCYGAVGRIWYEGGVTELLQREYGISPDLNQRF